MAKVGQTIMFWRDDRRDTPKEPAPMPKIGQKVTYHPIAGGKPFPALVTDTYDNTRVTLVAGEGTEQQVISNVQEMYFLKEDWESLRTTIAEKVDESGNVVAEGKDEPARGPFDPDRFHYYTTTLD